MHSDSSFGIEAQKLLDELRSHDVPFTGADANVLVDIGDKNVARGLPDLQADDAVIAGQVAAAFPQFSDQQRADSVRCLAEYVEQTIAKNRGTVRRTARTTTDQRVLSFTHPGATPIVGRIVVRS
jgi:hypothetical protein